MQRPADQPDVQHAQYVPQRLCGRGGDGEVRGLRALRGELSRRRGEAGPEAVHQGRLYRVSPGRAARRGEVGPGEVEHRLSGPQPHQLLRHRHRTLQDRLPRPHRRAGLSEAGGTGQVPGGFAAHQAGEPISCRVRPHLQPPVRGCLHPRHRGRGRGHRRGKALYRSAGPGRGDALHPGEGHSQGGRRIQRKNRHHRWRPRRHELRLLSGGKGLSPHCV